MKSVFIQPLSVFVYSIPLADFHHTQTLRVFLQKRNRTQNGNTTFMDHQMKNEEVRIWQHN